ncbi:carbohydrate-binding protein [Actinoplanes sp. NPDC023936]|uniref:carbohydrate-binding protein n=1 Tax=Actinoplanes sp. NPDC023936 TaxID=3154910 RepID=UPI0033E63F9B
MDHRSPSVYRTRSWTNRRRLLTALGGVALVLVGYAIGRWQDTPAEVVPAVPVAASAAAPAPGSEPATESAPDPATGPGSGPGSESASGPATNASSPQPATPAPVAVEYPVMQAESATELAGIQTQETEDSGGGLNTAWITRSDHLRFDNIDFGQVPATKARIRLSSDAGVTGRVQIRLDSKDNQPVGEVSVSSTGGWQQWRTDTAALQPITGVHTVFVTFTAPDDSEFVNVNWLQFAR